MQMRIGGMDLSELILLRLITISQVDNKSPVLIAVLSLQGNVFGTILGSNGPV